MNPLVERLGWMLIHSLWEGFAIWLLLEIAMIALRRQAAAVRHGVACAALAAMILVPWATFGGMDLAARSKENARHLQVTQGAMLQDAQPEITQVSAPAPARAIGSGSLPSDWKGENLVREIMPWLVDCWILGVFLWSARLFVAWRFMRRLVQSPLSPLSQEWKQRLDALCQRAGVQRLVRMGESLAVTGPLIIGWAKPLILLPVGALMRLSPDQVEAVILHELAHLRRHDFLVNVLQCVAEAIFFYHPAIHWANARIRREREWACDDLTVTWCENPLGYARALEAFESFRGVPFALAASEVNLLERIRRIVLGTEPTRSPAWVFGLAALFAVGAYLLTMFVVPALAANAMSSQERIALIDSARAQSAEEGLIPKDSSKTITIHGTVRAEDNRPLPHDLMGYTLVRYMGGSTQSNFGINQDGHFSQTIVAGRISLALWVDGYAPLKFMSGFQGYRAPLDFVLKKGLAARLHLVDPEGRPVEGATINGTITGTENYPTLSLPERHTDALGMVTLGQVETDTLLDLSVTKPGWELTEKRLSQWSDGNVATWFIRPSQPTTGLVVDEATQRPIGDAAVLWASYVNTSGMDHTMGDPIHAPVLGHSDRDGKFSVDGFNRDYGYSLYLRAKGYQTGVLRLRGSDRGAKIALKRGITVHGRILDPKGLLKSIPHPAISCELQIANTPTASQGYTLSQPLLALTPEIPFVLEDLSPQDITVHVAEHKIQLKVPDHDVTDFVIDLGAPTLSSASKAEHMRTVRITLVTEPGQPVTTGELGVQYEKEGSFTSTYVPIVDGTAMIKMTTPNRVILYADHLVGYWFANDLFEVPSGEQDLAQSIPLLPAGLIHGRVTIDSGMEEQRCLCEAISIKPSPFVPRGRETLGGMGQNSGDNPLDHYVSRPLPVGGVYSIVLWIGNNFTVSSPIPITAEKPVVEYDMHRIDGTTLRGVCVDDNGHPLAMQPLELLYQPGDHGFSSNAGYTATDGTFAIAHVNLNVPGYYVLSVNQPHGGLKGSSDHIDSSTPMPLRIVCPEVVK